MHKQPDLIVDPGDTATFFYQSGTYTPDQSIGFLMRRVLSSILQAADAQLAEQGLTYVQWLPLYKLLLYRFFARQAEYEVVAIDPGASAAHPASIIATSATPSARAVFSPPGRSTPDIGGCRPARCLPD